MLIFLGGVERVLWGSRAAIGLHQAATTTAIDSARALQRTGSRTICATSSLQRRIPFRDHHRHVVPIHRVDLRPRRDRPWRRVEASKRREWTCSAPKQAGAWRN